MDEVTEICKCGRVAKWLFPGNKYSPPEWVCGYHKRAYTRTWKVLGHEPERVK